MCTDINTHTSPLTMTPRQGWGAQLGCSISQLYEQALQRRPSAGAGKDILIGARLNACMAPGQGPSSWAAKQCLRF